MYIELLKATVAVSRSTSSPVSSSMKDSFSPCDGLLDQICDDSEDFLPDDDEERRTFKKECEATEALIRISGMLLMIVTEMRQHHICGRSAALVRPRLKPNAKRKLTF